jgi:GNAT superfamily N-acetyltransferase
MLAKWVSTDKVAEVRRFIIQEGGLDRCWISLVKPGFMGGPTTLLNLRIPPAHKHLVSAAIAFGEAQAREMSASALICEVREDDEHAVEALRSGGWSQERRQRLWRLDLEVNENRIRKLRSVSQRKLETLGVAIRNVADLGGEPFLSNLLPVRHESVADIPKRVVYIPESFEDMAVWMRPPAVLPERIWVAVLGDLPVGYSYLAYWPSGVETSFTGVLREQRGKGLGRALKLEALVQAIDLGVVAVETEVDSENAPILHIDQELGYVEMPGRLELHRSLT